MLMRPRIDLSNFRFRTTEKLNLYFSNSIVLWFGTSIVVGLWWIKGRDFTEMGISMPTFHNKYWIVLCSLVFILYVIDAWFNFNTTEKIRETRSKWRHSTPFLPTNVNELIAFGVLAFSAAICEEILYRGYFITYLVSWWGTGGFAMIFAVFIPASLFAVAHVYQGWQSVSKILLGAVLFGLIFVFTQSLLLPVALHFFVDIMGGLLSVFLMHGQEKEVSNEEEE